MHEAQPVLLLRNKYKKLAEDAGSPACLPCSCKRALHADVSRIMTGIQSCHSSCYRESNKSTHSWREIACQPGSKVVHFA